MMVAFRYGDPASPTWLRLTDWSKDVVNGILVAGGVFTSLPSMEFKLPANSGMLKDGSCDITLPLSLSFADVISNGEAHSDVHCWVLEYAKAPGKEAITLVHFRGDVVFAVRNAGGKPDRVKLVAKSWKAQLKQQMGQPILSQCVLTHGDARCTIDVIALGEAATVGDVVGKQVQLIGLSAQADRYWDKGYVSRDGLNIRIRDWLDGDTFELGRPPPSSWDGQSVTVFPGCDKTPGVCEVTWLNLEHFNGAGTQVAARNPVFEKQ